MSQLLFLIVFLFASQANPFLLFRLDLIHHMHDWGLAACVVLIFFLLRRVRLGIVELFVCLAPVGIALTREYFQPDSASIGINETLLAYLTLSLSAVYVGRTLNIEGLQHLIRRFTMILVALSAVYALLSPDFGLHSARFGFAFKGIFPSKNAFGIPLALTLVSLVLFSPARKLAMIVVFLALLLCQTRSLFMILPLSLLAGILLSTAFKRQRSQALKVLSGFAVFSVLIAVVFISVREQLPPFFRTLGGRTTMWSYVLEHTDPSLLGYGNFVGSQVQIGMGSALGYGPYVDNGFVQTYFEFGLLGFGAIVVFCAAYLFAVFAAGERLSKGERTWYFSLFFFFLSINLFGGWIFQPWSLPWIIILVSYSQLLQCQKGSCLRAESPLKPSKIPSELKGATGVHTDSN